MAIHVRHAPGFSIDVASRIFRTIAAKINDGSVDVVNVSDAAIKQHCRNKPLRSGWGGATGPERQLSLPLN